MGKGKPFQYMSLEQLEKLYRKENGSQGPTSHCSQKFRMVIDLNEKSKNYKNPRSLLKSMFTT